MIMWLYFVLSGGFGYIAPITVDISTACGKPFIVAGLQVDRPVNPTVARWADCEVDISGKLAELPMGTYHLAATGFGPYNAPDPHVSAYFQRNATAMPRPTDLKIKP